LRVREGTSDVRFGRGSEHWLAFFAARLPQPLHREESEEAIIYVAGEPGEVVVRLSPRAIDIAEFTVRVTSEAMTVVPRWLGRVRWRRIPEDRAIELVETLIAAARELRRSRFRECAVCERLTPPEAMLDDWTCRVCAGPDAPARSRHSRVH
jgi:hypothetical protein